MKLKKRLSFLFQEGLREKPRGVFFIVFTILAVSLSVFELWLGSVGNMSPYAYAVAFLTGILPVSFITTRFSKKSTPVLLTIDYIFAFIVLGAGLHFIMNMDVLLSRISGVDPLSSLDIISGLIIIVAVLELTRRTLGFGLTFLLLIGLGYTFFGHFINGPFGHRLITIDHFIEEMVFTTNGIFGAPVQVAATYAFLFIMFGHFFQKAGAGQFIFDICAAFMGKKVGGLAKVAVTSAGIFGSISGSPSSDVATTGSINIPMMKKRGYSPVFAGAVEAAAATGGTILPPIMGSVAFLMAEFTGIRYVDIAIASVLSAILYYLGIYFQVHFRSLKLNLVGLPANEIPRFKDTFKNGFFYILPVIALVWAMLSGFTPSLAACFGIAVTFVLSFVRRSTWITWRHIIDIFNDVVYSIAPLTVACATAGIIIGVINLTGMAGKITSLIFTMTGGNLLLSLIVSAVICIILGMGMPTASVYVLVAALVSPALIQLGLDVLPTHLFLLFFSALSAITPPVGVAAFTASGIANANPIAIGFQASKLAFVGFLIPFMFVFQPSLLLQGSLLQIVFTAITAVIGVYALAAGYESYLFNSLNIWKRIALIFSGIAMIYPGFIINVAAGIVIGAIVINDYLNKKKSVLINSQVIEFD
ncbi:MULTISPECIES: TRAP transporter permease [Bacillaceae]|uniref:TRAP transporter permease n=1 Tax=Bacillaceae TaxID=186817 RepID=UPI0011883061|nr:TRAP transporter fused permease subunit [Bacillus sp. S3]QCJ41223.1 TRAP transporter fused permease subunit [Bacillus sp. S3]